MNNLLEKTISMTQELVFPISEMCKSIGVTTRWYNKVIKGDIEDPSVRKVQKLHDYLLNLKEQSAESKSA
jgi:transcriptional regulator with XRE-family HTH domain